MYAPIIAKTVRSISKIWNSNGIDIQNASMEYKLGVTPILLLLQKTSSSCLWTSVAITNVSFVAKWRCGFLFGIHTLCSYTNLNLPLGINNIYSFFYIWSSCNLHIQTSKRSALLHRHNLHKAGKKFTIGYSRYLMHRYNFM